MLWIILLVLIIFADQLSKWLVVAGLQGREPVYVIKGVLRFTYVENDGAAFGMLDDHRWVFLVLSTVMIAALIYYICKYKPTSKWVMTSLILIVGGGAAGAMAGGAVAFLGASVKMGIDVVLDTVGFDRLLEDADLVFTGEGKLDSQSLQGKVVFGVAKFAKAKGVPVIAVVGGVEGDASEIYDMGVNAVFTINRLPEDLSVSRYKSEENLAYTAEDILRILKMCGR